MIYVAIDASSPRTVPGGLVNSRARLRATWYSSVLNSCWSNMPAACVVSYTSDLEHPCTDPYWMHSISLSTSSTFLLRNRTQLINS